MGERGEELLSESLGRIVRPRPRLHMRDVKHPESGC
jgi:hypothetical protein